MPLFEWDVDIEFQNVDAVYEDLNKMVIDSVLYPTLNKTATKAKDQIDTFLKKHKELVSIVMFKGMNSMYWKEISKVVNGKISVTKESNLQSFLFLAEKMDFILPIVNRARREFHILSMLEQINTFWFNSKYLRGDELEKEIELLSLKDIESTSVILESHISHCQFLLKDEYF